MSTFRVFSLTLFAIAAAAVLAVGWQGGEPWTAAAFVAFFVSRVVRFEMKRSSSRADDDPIRRANRFILVTAVGWLGSGALALVAAVVGEGQEWLYVAPFFLLMGALNLYVAFR